MAEGNSNFSRLRKFVKNLRVSQNNTLARLQRRIDVIRQKRDLLKRSRRDIVVREVARELQLKLNQNGLRSSAEAVGNLFDPSDEVVINAIGHLSQSRVNGSAELIAHFLRSDNFEIRIAAVKSLGAFGDKKAIPLIKNLLKDPVPKVRETVQETIAQLK